jgi:hypothetical protein
MNEIILANNHRIVSQPQVHFFGSLSPNAFLRFSIASGQRLFSLKSLAMFLKNKKKPKTN